jgi:hypothetical protein
VDRDAGYVSILRFINIRDYVQFENHRFSCVHSMFVNHPVCAPQNLHMFVNHPVCALQNLHKNVLVLKFGAVALWLQYESVRFACQWVIISRLVQYDVINIVIICFCVNV